MSTNNSMCPVQRGVSLIELIMFIVIVSVALAGILLVMNTVTRGSADPLIHKQALAIAESMLEEVELMPFTFCDPDDPAASLLTTLDANACTAPVGGEVMGPEAGEARAPSPNPFDNVNDYVDFQMAAGAITDINGNSLGLNGYTLEKIQIVPVALTGVAATEALLITVSVTGPDGVSVTIDGIRTRYSPRSVP